MSPITAEGFFPKQKVHYVIELKGNGKDGLYRNQPGFHYSYPDTIECKQHFSWDFGYAWVDKNYENIYINFYWVKAPDSLRDSEISGKYKIKQIQPGNPPDCFAPGDVFAEQILLYVKAF